MQASYKLQAHLKFRDLPYNKVNLLHSVRILFQVLAKYLGLFLLGKRGISRVRALAACKVRRQAYPQIYFQICNTKIYQFNYCHTKLQLVATR